MYLVAIAWLYVVVLMALAEGMSTGGSWLGAAFTFLLYGALPLVVSLLAELIRIGSASQELGDLDIHSLPPGRQTEIALAIFRRDTGIMATACLVIFLLALRAAGTSSAF